MYISFFMLVVYILSLFFGFIGTIPYILNWSHSWLYIPGSALINGLIIAILDTTTDNIPEFIELIPIVWVFGVFLGIVAKKSLRKRT